MKNKPRRSLLALRLLAGFVAACAMLGATASAQQPSSSPVKLYLMIGQSNMEGQGEVAVGMNGSINPQYTASTPGTLEYIVANDPGSHYQFLVDGLGNWVTRNDVWVYYNNGRRKLNDATFPINGNLQPGWGPVSPDTIGPELGFGHKMGNLHGNQVLLVKTAWGGKSLYNDFLPPSSRIGKPEPRAHGDAGFYYSEVLRLMKDATSNPSNYFPTYNGQGYEIAGICWHQGWNDASRPRAEYETNLSNLIRDIRKDLGVPNCPFVIATTGMAQVKEIEAAQLAMEDFTTYPEFAGNVSVIDTRAETYFGYTYEQPVADSPTDQNSHWNRNARTYLHIGLAMGDAMATLDLPRCPSRLGAASNVGSTGVTLTWQNGTEMPNSVRILRDGVQIAAAAPVSPASYLDSSVLPGTHTYELQFTMPVSPCDPLTVTHYSGITGLTAYRSQNGVVLNWQNNLGYAGIQVSRNGAVIAPGVSGTVETYQDTTAPTSGVLTYRVIPTTGTSTPAEVVINLGPQLTGNTVIYEPFDFPSGTLLGGVPGGFGLGTWSGGGEIEPLSLEFGDHPIAGNRYSGNGNTPSWAAVGSSLSAAGLLNHGAQLWFSFLAHPVAGVGTDNGFIGLSSSTGNFGTNFGSVPAGANVFGFWFNSGRNMQLAAAVGGTPASLVTGKNEMADNVPTLVVGKFTWGANGTANDTLQLYLPKIDRLQPTSATATKTAVIDQSTFSQLGVWMKNSNCLLDEVRFGATYNAVVGVGYESQLDYTPPTPAQMSWASPPAGASDSSITMTAVSANDENGVEYYFTCTTAGGHDSGWQDSPTYVDTGLSPSTSCSYTVQARDKSLNHNTNTVSSPPAGATTFPPDATPPPVPTLVTPLGPITLTTVFVSANPVLDGEGSGVEYRFHNTTLATNSGWLSNPTWTNSGLTPGTTYFYTVQSRDTAANHNESAQSSPQTATTLSGAVTVADSFTYKWDYTPSDNSTTDTVVGAVASPLAITPTGFTASGTDKLVVVLSLHNSAARVAPLTDVSYGGVSLYSNFITGTSLTGTSDFTRQAIFYLDHPTVDGNLTISFTNSDSGTLRHIDEVGVQLFALNGTVDGIAYAFQAMPNLSATTAFSSPADALTGDFVVGVAQRNNNANTITVGSPYTSINITTGNLTAITGNQVVASNGLTSPLFSRNSGGSTVYQSFAAFAAAATPVSSGYDSWAAANAPATGGDMTADEDGDGVTNGIEFVVGGTISSNDLGKLPAVSTNGTNMIFSFKRAQQSIDPSVSVSIEVGTSLIAWPNVYPVPDAATVGPPVTVVKSTSPGMDTVTLSLPMTPGVGKFARLKVIVTP